MNIYQIIEFFSRINQSKQKKENHSKWNVQSYFAVLFITFASLIVEGKAGGQIILDANNKIKKFNNEIAEKLVVKKDTSTKQAWKKQLIQSHSECQWLNVVKLHHKIIQKPIVQQIYQKRVKISIRGESH